MSSQVGGCGMLGLAGTERIESLTIAGPRTVRQRGFGTCQGSHVVNRKPMKNKNQEAPELTEQYIQQLQDELAAATERSRLAKRALKDAKADAKIAKRDKKQARKVLIAAQAALEEQIAATAPARVVAELTDATHQRIPDSPEVNRKRRRKSRPKDPVADSPADIAPVELADQTSAALVK